MPIVRAAPDAHLDLLSEPSGKVIVGGQRNRLRIGPDVRFEASMEILGHDCEVVIGASCHIMGALRIQPGVKGRVVIGPGTSAAGAAIGLHEDGEILIGGDCMLSMDLYVEVSDIHPIFDATSGRRINPARSIRIGDHVWMGRRVLVMKGAEIGDGAVIGSGAVVGGRVPPGSVAAGAPARVLRKNIEWRRGLASRLPAPLALSRGWGPWRRTQGAADLPRREGGGRLSLDRVGGVAMPFDQPAVTVSPGPLLVDGFAYDAEGSPVRAVEVVVDDRAYPTRYGEFRPDVAEATGREGLAATGFRGLVPAEALPPGLHGLFIRLILADGRHQDVSGGLPFTVA